MAEIQKVTDPAQIVTDPVLLNALAKQGIDKDYVEFWHDYAPRSMGKQYSPYAKFYRDLNSGLHFMVVSGLPMVDAYGQQHELAWSDKNGIIESGNNIFHAIIERGDIRLIALSDQPAGARKDDEVTCHPQLFIGGAEVQPASVTPSLLETDPVNESYSYNTLEWDYGICKRRLRLIEGHFLGSWVFLANPGGDVLIKYNQIGKLSLRLQYARNHGEEFIPKAFFDEEKQYPVIISDSATFYPDADPETTSVDGVVGRVNTSGSTWADIRDGAGTNPSDSGTYSGLKILCYTSASKWQQLNRVFLLFDTSTLPDDTSISAATLSVYGYSKGDGVPINGTVNVYSSNPASNVGLVAEDYSTLGSTPYSTDITYANWKTTSPYWNDFALNAAGIATISKTGVTKFGLRESTYDAPNVTPAWASAANFYLYAYFAEKGTGYKPKLVVTYSTLTEKSSSEMGSGAESLISRLIGATETGSAMEAALLVAALFSGDEGVSSELGGLLKAVMSGDGGGGSEALKALIKTAGSGSDMWLPGRRGQVRIPSKGVNL